MNKKKIVNNTVLMIPLIGALAVVFFSKFLYYEQTTTKNLKYPLSNPWIFYTSWIVQVVSILVLINLTTEGGVAWMFWKE